MTYEVLAGSLRDASGRYRTVATSLGSEGPEITHVEPDSLGHVELAAWLTAVVDQCDKAAEALHTDTGRLADSLDASARYYETTDEQVGFEFQRPMPFFGPTPTAQ